MERAAMARMGFFDKAEELDAMIEAERARLKKVQPAHQPPELAPVKLGAR